MLLVTLHTARMTNNNTSNEPHQAMRTERLKFGSPDTTLFAFSPPWTLPGAFFAVSYRLGFLQGLEFIPCASRYFVAEDTDDRSDTMDEWPPFRRVGRFDPFSDDPR